MTGTEEVNPIKFGAPAVDYATGTMGAFALASALFQRERTGKGQHIDLAMVGVAMMLMGSHLTGYLRNGAEPKPHGNKQPFATNSCYEAKDGLLMIGASNLGQQRRLWTVSGAARHDQARQRGARGRPRARSRGARRHHQDPHARMSGRSICKRGTCRRLGCGRWPRRSRTRISKAAGVFHHHASAPGVEGPFGVPLAAFKFAHGGPSIETPPPEFGADTDAVLAEHGYGTAEIAEFRRVRVIG